MSNYEIIKFVDGDFELDVNVSPQQNTIWLTQDQIAKLFGKSRSTITEHINNIFSEGELFEMTSVGNSDITNHRPAKLYNLDVILAVGYRVKSKRGILFRRWATAVLRNYLIKGYSLSSDRVIVTNENYIQLINDVNHLKKDVEDIKGIVNRNVLDSIIIYEGDSFDGFSFINDLIKKAIESVIIIDGYADDSLFDFLIGSKKGIKKVVICHKANRITKEIINRFEKEYGPIVIKEDKTYHDRFLIIDNEIYLMGTSLNSIGHKTSSVIKCNQFNIKDIIKDE
ncbi:MAG: virulence RhuM family protein [Firmicutes bacterium]|uniref:Virulence RhuM family protein n=1 Tax=Candidatus Onthovivens merdipullorum TaxID=2840889 RepID=A0A9D9GU78_9BACL|nr:virulence RhuM family protein [Candidatus Onthovivens merdipullorum]